MVDVPLYNLFLGRFAAELEQQVAVLGGLQIDIVSDYDAKALHMIHDFEPSAHPKTVNWLHTATAHIDENSDQCSLLSSDLIRDAGLSDACMLLTFLTGRPVLIETQFYSHNFGCQIPQVCESAKTFSHLEHSWPRRHMLRDVDITPTLVAFLSYLESAGVFTAQLKSYLYSAAIELLSSEVVMKLSNPLSKSLRQDLKRSLATLVDDSLSDTPDQSTALIARLSAIVDQGPLTAVDKFLALLTHLEILSETEVQDAIVISRARIVNRIRNGIIHSVTYPRLGSLTTYDSNPIVDTVIGNILPSIIQIWLTKKLGIWKEGNDVSEWTGNWKVRLFMLGHVFDYLDQFCSS